jgi:urease accessory protein
MISELQITAAAKEEHTWLQHCYYTRPFKVANISGKGRGILHLTMMSASPGILDGDEYDIRIILGEDAGVHLYTQSYQRIFNMQQGAKQRFQVEMAKGSSLCYLPHPAVPHEQSIFDSASRIQLAENCRLLWGEIITCGRKLSGEIFRCTHFQNIIEVYRGNKLLFKDVTVLQPQIVPAGSMGQWEEYTHQASLFWHDESQDMTAMADLLHEWLSAEKNIAAGVSRTASGALLLRILGQGGEQLYELFKKIATLAGEERKL